jgi:hypothetical protein
MVHSLHGHRDRLYPPAFPSLQRRLAVLALRHNFRTECPVIRGLQRHICSEIYGIPGDMASYDTASHVVAVPGSLFDGVEYDRMHAFGLVRINEG